MAHFYGSVQGNKGEATRMGSKASGISGYVQGHYSRIRTGMYEENDYDHGSIVIEGGYSARAGRRIDLGYLNTDALVSHGDDPQVDRELAKARNALAKASELAEKAAGR